MNLRNLAIWAVIVVVAAGVWSMMHQRGAPNGAASSQISYSQLLAKVDNGEVADATFQGSTVQVHGSDKSTMTAVVPNDSSDLIKRMETRGVDVQIKLT